MSRGPRRSPGRDVGHEQGHGAAHGFASSSLSCHNTDLVIHSIRNCAVCASDKALFLMNLSTIQDYLRTSRIDGWLLYDFRGLNPIALHVAGLTRSGSRRWFLWIPAEGQPVWLIHAIESSTFAHINPVMAGEVRQYVGWRDLEHAVAEAGPHAPRPCHAHRHGVQPRQRHPLRGLCRRRHQGNGRAGHAAPKSSPAPTWCSWCRPC